MNVRPSSVAELALRVATTTGTASWLVLVVPEGREREIAIQLSEDIQALGQVKVAELTEVPGAESLINAIREAPSDSVVVVTGLDLLTNIEWEHLDLLRSRLLSKRSVVLVLTRSGAGVLTDRAPNLASWIGGAIWELDLARESLSPEDRDARLTFLRKWARKSDEEILGMARAGKLPKEPEFTEWLVLLGRADLIAPA